jgi:hypothetical protein
MNPHDAPTLPLLAALNIHPMHRRQGVVVRRGEVVEALHDLHLEKVALPKGRLIDAAEAELTLAEAGMSVPLVLAALSVSPWATIAVGKRTKRMPNGDPTGPGAHGKRGIRVI